MNYSMLTIFKKRFWKFRGFPSIFKGHSKSCNFLCKNRIKIMRHPRIAPLINDLCLFYLFSLAFLRFKTNRKQNRHNRSNAIIINANSLHLENLNCRLSKKKCTGYYFKIYDRGSHKSGRHTQIFRQLPVVPKKVSPNWSFKEMPLGKGAFLPHDYLWIILSLNIHIFTWTMSGNRKKRGRIGMIEFWICPF